MRRVATDCAVEVDGNAYPVPWRLLGERVSIVVTGTDLRVSHAGERWLGINCDLAGMVASLMQSTSLVLLEALVSLLV